MGGLRQPRFPGGQIVRGAAAAQFTDDHVGERREVRDVRGAELSRRHVEDAERADVNAGSEIERCTSIEANMRRAGDEHVAAQTRVFGGVRHHQRFVSKNGEVADRILAFGFAQVDPGGRKKALLVAVDERDQRHRNIEQVAGERADAIDLLDGPGAQQVEIV